MRNPEAAAGWRRPVWLTILIVASFIFSLGLACAVPLAAFAAAAALTLPRRDALLVTTGVWLANQIVGFGPLHYPTDPTTIMWGVVLGVVTVAATAAAQAIIARLAHPLTAALAAFAGAFIVYEGGLFLAALGLGGMSAFAPDIMAEVLGINIAGFMGLLLLDQIGGMLGLAEGMALRLSPK